MSGLLACPFCGGDRNAEVFVRDGRSVGCTECKASVTAYQPDASAKARQAWNTRNRMSEWHDISTAPKDGRHILLARFDADGDAEEVVLGCWNLWPKKGQDGLNGFNAWIDNPTHWMPRPSNPKQVEAAQS